MNEMAKKKGSTPGENLEMQITEQYKPKSVADMRDALKNIFGPMFEAMLQGEMNGHLGYENNDHGTKSTDNCRNGYTNKKSKQVQVKSKSKYLETEIRVLNLNLCRNDKNMYPK